MQNSYMNYFDLTDKIFFTLAIVIIVTCISYKFTIKLGKPMVIGGIISGFILSHVPLSEKYFNIDQCTILGNLGIVMFMMFVGTEFNFKRLLVNKTNIILPVILVLVPFILGFTIYPLLLSLGLIDAYGIQHKWMVALFIGLALSMSTFSILIMFVNNTSLRFSRIGKIAIFCATFEEGAFWIIFGIILAFFQQNLEIKIAPMVYLIAYLIFVIFISPYVIKKIVNKISTELTMLGFIVVGCLLSAVLADLVNLHPIFGGFIFGVLLPKNNHIIHKLRGYLMEFIIIILLPIYFVKTGMDASTNLSFDSITIIISVIMIAVSFLGKYGGAFIVGRIWNFSNNEVMILGSLLSIRGTMEVAILNVGHEVGLLGTKPYSALIIMTLVTTWLATTLSSFFNKHKNVI